MANAKVAEKGARRPSIPRIQIATAPVLRAPLLAGEESVERPGYGGGKQPQASVPVSSWHVVPLGQLP